MTEPSSLDNLNVRMLLANLRASTDAALQEFLVVEDDIWPELTPEYITAIAYRLLTAPVADITVHCEYGGVKLGSYKPGQEADMIAAFTPYYGKSLQACRISSDITPHMPVELVKFNLTITKNGACDRG